MSETVTVVRPSTMTDRYGNTVADWDTASRSRLTDCAVAPRTEAAVDEVHGLGRQGVVIGYNIYAPPGADVEATDRIEVRGEVHDVDGFPAVWISPFSDSGPGGVEIATRRVEG